MAGKPIRFDMRHVWLPEEERVLFEADPEAEVKKVETNSQDRIFVLVRGRLSQSKTNVVAIDEQGTVVWKAKDRPTDFDDELVDFLYREPLLQTWSWNYVYEFDG
ncbi:MAG: hypothetical protein Q8R92_16515, partial [Deltaproteobacteria bacterium]|nr:hypothetical protein [Deltaproteobacteria bacterium]